MVAENYSLPCGNFHVPVSDIPNKHSLFPSSHQQSLERLSFSRKAEVLVVCRTPTLILPKNDGQIFKEEFVEDKTGDTYSQKTAIKS
jgi:hypothetical protein